MVAVTCSPLVFTDVKTCLLCPVERFPRRLGVAAQVGQGVAQRTDDHWLPLKGGHSTPS